MNIQFAARGAVVFGIASIVAVGSAQMIGNFPPGAEVITSADIDNLRHKAMGFTMGNNPYSLKVVDVRVSNYLTPSQLTLEIWSNSTANNPDQLLHQLIAPPATGAAFATASFMVNGAFIFNPGTTYWLRMSGVLGSGPNWGGSSPGITPTGPGATHFGGRFTTNAGTSWANSTGLNSYQIHAKLVPESATFVAIGLGLALLLKRRR